VIVGADAAATALRAITLKDNAYVLNEVLAHGQPRYWTREEAAGWAEPMHQFLSPEARAALTNRLWDYYEARVDGRLSTMLHGDRG
jgi:hypothetical protein